jgi:Xaa-Pro aminopeptidase
MPKAAFRNCTDIVEELRMIKSEDEKTYIEKACKITDDVLEEAQDYLKVGKTEMDVTREVLARCLNHGADGASFYPQMFSGKRGYLLNITSSFEKKLQTGEIVLVDFGAVYKGYGCDTTRVFTLGKPTKEQEKAHAATRQIVDECVKAVRPGIKASDIHKVALSKFAEFGYEAVHTTGHGIGLTNWERPYLSPDEQTIIQPNMTMAVEQGVYTPNWGTRLEENLIVTESGVRNLFKFPLDMIEIR